MMPLSAYAISAIIAFASHFRRFSLFRRRHAAHAAIITLSSELLIQPRHAATADAIAATLSAAMPDDIIAVYRYAIALLSAIGAAAISSPLMLKRLRCISAATYDAAYAAAEASAEQR